MTTPSEETLTQVAGFFRLLAEPMRLQILVSLKGGEKNVSQVCDAVQGTQANISKHLLLLFRHGVLHRRHEGNNVVYTIANPLIFELCDLVCNQLANAMPSRVD